jgi:5-methylcytosine-specific restriction endonuclease McrA
MEKLEPTEDKRCGTYAGDKAHRRRGEMPCEPCTAARRKYEMDLYWKDPEKSRAEGRATMARHTAVKQRARIKRRALLADGREKYTLEQVLDTYGTNCFKCNEPIDLDAPRLQGRPGWEKGLHIDHALAISKGGKDTLANARPLHAQCNLRKRSNPLEDHQSVMISNSSSVIEEA